MRSRQHEPDAVVLHEPVSTLWSVGSGVTSAADKVLPAGVQMKIPERPTYCTQPRREYRLYIIDYDLIFDLTLCFRAFSISLLS